MTYRSNTRKRRKGIGTNGNNNTSNGNERKVPLWAAMVALVGTAFLFGRKQR